MKDIIIPDHWSHTFLQACRDCPAAAQAKLHREPAVVPDNVRTGKELHEAIARLAVQCWEKGVTQDQDAAQRIADGYDATTTKSLLAFAKQTRWPWRKMRAALPEDATCPVEQRWECDLPNGARFVGVVDLCLVEKDAGKSNPFADSADVVTLIDWKQGRPPAWNDTDAPEQLAGYAVMYRRAHNAEQHDYRLMYGAPGWQGKWELKEWSIGKVELDRAEAQLCARIDRWREEREWPANPGESCARCFYTAACPLRGTDTFKQLTEASPSILAQAAAYHAAMAADAHKQLKALAKAGGGVVDVAGVPWGNNPKTSLRPLMDDASLDEYCRSQGHSRDELTNGYSKAAIQKAIKDGWLPADAVEEVKVGNTFGPLKADDDDAQGEADGN